MNLLLLVACAPAPDTPDGAVVRAEVPAADARAVQAAPLPPTRIPLTLRDVAPAAPLAEEPARAWSSTARGWLEPGEEVLDLDVAPDGSGALVVTRGGRGGPRVWAWSPGAEPTPLDPLVDRDVRELAWSAEPGVVYALAVSPAPSRERAAATTPTGRRLPRGTSPAPVEDWRVLRCVPAGGALGCSTELATSNVPLRGLVTTPARWDGELRLAYARAWAEDRWQAVTLRDDGTGAYELTSPDKDLSPLTDPAIREVAALAAHPRAREPGEPEPVAPGLWTLSSAVPLDWHPVTGALLVRDEDGRALERRYAGRWLGGDAVAEAGTTVRWHPGGWYRVEQAEGAPGLTLVDSEGHRFPVAPELPAGAPWALTPDGGAVLATVPDGDRPALVVLPLDAPLVRVRGLVAGADAEGRPAPRLTAAARAAIARDEGSVTPAPAAPLVALTAAPPSLVTADTFAELLDVGTAAVTWTVEDEVATPAFRAFTGELARAAGERGLARVADVAALARAFAAGDYASPEGRLLLAGRRAASPLHGRELDYGALQPPRAWATPAARADRYRAQAWLDALELDDGARATLAGDAALVDAWRTWVDATAGLTAPSAATPFFPGVTPQGAWPDARWIDAACLPADLRAERVRLAPHPWGLVDALRAGQGSAAGCTDADPDAPATDALLAGLAAPPAWAPSDAGTVAEARAAVLAALARGASRSGAGDAALPPLPAEAPPAAADPSPSPSPAWSARLRSTALGTLDRAALPPLPLPAAGPPPLPDAPAFERLAAPALPVLVDPVPEAWDALSAAFDRLARRSEATPVPDGIPEALHAAAADTHRFAALARAQADGILPSGDDAALLADAARWGVDPYRALVERADPDPAGRPAPARLVIGVPVGAAVYPVTGPVFRPLADADRTARTSPRSPPR